MKVFNFQLQRYSDDFFSTLGLLHECFTAGVTPKFWGFTLEDENRSGPKVPGDTRIAGGKVYEIQLMRTLTPLTAKYREDSRFKDFFVWHLWLKDVEGFTGIYIHVGNHDGHTDGCILLGDQATTNIKPGNDGRIGASVDCYTRFYQYLYPKLEAGDRAFLQVRDESDLILP